MNKIIWYIGKKFPKFKMWYYNKTSKWHWGLIPFTQESQKTNPRLIKEESLFSTRGSAWLDKHLDEIFKSKR